MTTLNDTIPFDYEIVKESVEEGASDAPRSLRIRGPFQRADIKNGNGRVYERRLMEREVKKLNEAIVNRQIVGEVDHPDDGTMKLGNASHLITKLEMQKDGVVLGELEILPTHAGNHLRALAEAGVRIGISSRGVGTTSKREGIEYVNEDYQLRTFDVVSDPSTPGAWGTLVHENKQQEAESTDMSNKQRFEDLKAQASQISETNVENLEARERKALVEKAEGLIESLDRVGQEDAGFRSLTSRYISQLSSKIDEADGDKTTPSARLQAAEQVIGALVQEFAAREKRKDEKIEQALAKVLEKFQAARSQVAAEAQDRRRLEHRLAVTMEVGEQLLTGVRKARLKEGVDYLLQTERYSHLAGARKALLDLSSIEEAKQVLERLVQEIPAPKQQVKESKSGKTAVARLGLQPKKARLIESKNTGTAEPKNEMRETFDLLTSVTGLK